MKPTDAVFRLSGPAAKPVATAIAALLMVAIAFPASAQEVYVHGGTFYDTDSHGSSLRWSCSYRQNRGEHVAFGFSYLNEGNRGNHDRDGLAAQVWGRASLLEKRLSLALGIGPYAFADTLADPVALKYHNKHGLGLLSSATATWHGWSPLLLQVRFDGIVARDSFNSFGSSLGIGWLLGEVETGRPPPPRGYGGHIGDQEIALLGGQSVLNSSGSDKDTMMSVEYRRRILHHVDWTVAWIHEGDSRPFGRWGFASQLWLSAAFFDERLSLGIGVGPYVARDRFASENESKTKLTGGVSVSAAWRFHPKCSVRATVTRVFTDYDRDTDLFLGGLSYHF